MRFVQRIAEHRTVPRPVVTIAEIVFDTYVAWRNGRIIRLGGALAYYGLFSFASILTVTLALSHAVLGTDAVQDLLEEQLSRLLGSIGPEAAETLNAYIADANGQLGLIGAIALLVTGSLFFLALEDAFNFIWELPVQVGIRFSIRRRIAAALVLLATASILVTSFALQAITGLLGDYLPSNLPLVDLLERIVSTVLSWGVLVFALILLFRYVPATSVPWRAAIVGGAITSGVLVVGTSLIGWYLREFGASSLGGAASSVLAVLAWIFYEAQMLLAGAQLTKTLSDRWGPSGAEAVSPPPRGSA